MLQLAQAIPDVDLLLSLEPEELAAQLLLLLPFVDHSGFRATARVLPKVVDQARKLERQIEEVVEFQLS